MFPDAMAVGLDPTIVPWHKQPGRVVWIGALSFEERCTASLADLAKSGMRIAAGHALDYSTNIEPSLEGEERRRRNWGTFKALEPQVCVGNIDRVPSDPYSFHSLESAVQTMLTGGEVDAVIFDITCMTKIHALALAGILASYGESVKWAVAYTIPENYGTVGEAQRTLGWRDVIVAPLADTALLFNEAHSRGLIIAGHDPDRLIVALSEIEPSGGTVLLARSQGRPDLCYISERLNGKIIRQLTRMRSRDWTKKQIDMTDLDQLRVIVELEITLARTHQAPVILFPYGPKSLFFFAAMQLVADYPQASWFVYPIPSAYDVNHSEGIEHTIWITKGLRRASAVDPLSGMQRS